MYVRTRLALVVHLVSAATAAAAAPLGPAAPAAAAPLGPAAAPIRIAIECEAQGRTKACPAFLLGFVESTRFLHPAPRAAAEVVLYASAVEVALVDRVHLRFVGTVAGAPPVVEVGADIDTRAADDAQRAQLLPAFLRGAALYITARHPRAIELKLAEPGEQEIAAPQGSFRTGHQGWASKRSGRRRRSRGSVSCMEVS
jgi:hypothetical protein